MNRAAVGIGITTGILLFLLWQGIDIFPLVFLLALVGLALFLGNGLPGGRKTFVALGSETAKQKLVGFEDIGGQEVAKKELQEALEFLRDADRIKQFGIRPLKGILLTGPPGTGKTLLAKAAAQFTNAAFVAASGSEFVEMYVGVGAQRVRQLFKQAREQASRGNKQSAVIFIDEIEVLGGKRGHGTNNMEYDQTLNELLVQMDGLSLDDSVRMLVIAATNRIDMLDQALLRPGRFDRQVKVDLPDKKGRLHILRLHTRNKPLAPEVSLDDVAANTFGFSGAHLESLVNEAAILALREGSETINAGHFNNSIDKVIMGEKLDRIPSREERWRIAIHEAGHAIVSEVVLPGSVASVHVASRGNALGYVRQMQPDDQYLYTADFIKNKIAVALGGAVAEEIVLGNRSTGATSDFKQAAELAKQIVHGGMSELGIIAPDDIPRGILHSALASILKDAEVYTHGLLNCRKSILQNIATLLIDKEFLSGEEFRSILAGSELNFCA